MSQTVKIDAAAQDAIAEIVGMPWEKDYFDNTHDKDSAHVATVTREGVSVRIYICDESLCSADLWSFEAEQIGQAILNAAKDAKTGVSGFLCLGRLFQGQPNEAALCI